MILSLNLEQDSYDIVVERGVLEKARELLDLDRKVLVVTDDGVPAAYAQAILSQCADGVLVTLPAGEATKNLTSFQKLLSAMLSASFTRKDCVVAVGGGVVGDLSGFAAACYMRGIDFYNVPTTLLSQVDSSIGGKTAIDLDGVKNIVGAFYQPKKVLIDPDTLKTLDQRQFSAGMAEVIKMAMTSDARLFEKIKDGVSAGDAGAAGDAAIGGVSPEALEEIIISALQIKKDVVEQDPKENGVRKILNFGHTIGHAIEALEDGKLLHGECVALGMLPMCDDAARQELIPVLQKFDLPTEYKAKKEQLMPLLLHDKKMQQDGLAVILVHEIGSYEIRRVNPEEMQARLEQMQS